MKKLFIVLALFITACAPFETAQGPVGAKGDPGQILQVPPLAAPSELDVVLQEYNNTRLAQGQNSVSPNLSCYLYTVPTSTTKITGATGLVGVGGFVLKTSTIDQENGPVSNGLNILPLPLEATYKTWYIVKCSGVLLSTDDNWHQFSLTSDDGSNLYIDGAKLDNDGLHASVTVSYAKFLSRGAHSFQLEFLQGAGQESLVVNEDGNLMSTANLFH
jgi:hypothetical protein